MITDKSKAELQRAFETVMCGNLTDRERRKSFEAALQSCEWFDEHENEPYRHRELNETLTLREWFDHWDETVDDGDFRGWMCKNLEQVDHDRLLFGLTESNAQIMAEDVAGRTLTDEEMARVRKGVAAGLEGWQEIMETAIREAVKA